jgi:hypothetical protein
MGEVVRSVSRMTFSGFLETLLWSFEVVSLRLAFWIEHDGDLESTLSGEDVGMMAIDEDSNVVVWLASVAWVDVWEEGLYSMDSPQARSVWDAGIVGQDEQGDNRVDYV